MNGDPDIDQAISDLRAVFAELRVARARLAGLGDSPLLAKLGPARELVSDLRGRIAIRAEKLAMKPETLILILAADADLQGKLRRRPSRQQMTKALLAEVNENAAARADAERQLAIVRAALSKAARLEHLTMSALHAYQGVAA